MAKEYNIGHLNLPTKIVAYIVMFTFTFLTIGPLCWLFYSSFKLHKDITGSPLALPLPLGKDGVQPTLQNYRTVWTIDELPFELSIGKITLWKKVYPAFVIYFINSVFYTSVATILTVVLAVSAGYAFAKFNYRITNLFHTFFVLGLLVVVHSVLVPLFVMETKIGIINTRFGVILPYVAFGLPFAVYLATSYIKGIPDALVEASIIDGATYLQIFWHIILPVSRPIVTTMLIFTFLGNWNEFVLVFVLTSKAFLRSLPVGINAFAGGMLVDFGLRFASLSIGTVPIIIFYLLFRKQIEQGFAGAAVKE